MNIELELGVQELLLRRKSTFFGVMTLATPEQVGPRDNKVRRSKEISKQKPNMLEVPLFSFFSSGEGLLPLVGLQQPLIFVSNGGRS